MNCDPLFTADRVETIVHTMFASYLNVETMAQPVDERLRLHRTILDPFGAFALQRRPVGFAHHQRHLHDLPVFPRIL